MLRLFATILLVMALAGPVCAQPSERVASIAGWDILDDRGACSARKTYPQDVAVMVRYDSGRDAAVFFIDNPAWPAIEEGVTHTVTLHFDNDSTWRDSTARFMRLDGEGGRLTGVAADFEGDDFVEDFANARSVAVLLGHRRLDGLSLRGTRAVAERLVRCAAESARRHLPDPLAEAAAEPAADVVVEPARPLLDLSSYISNADYPASALRNEEEGTSRFRLDIGPDGRVTGCAIVGSSGSQALDTATCSLMRRRARFSPATTRGGSTVADTYESSIRWRIEHFSPRQEVTDNRRWVQVAVTASKPLLSAELARLRTLAPELLQEDRIWTVRAASTHRLLVGPFASAHEAHAFVNALAQAGIAAYAWIVPEDQQVERFRD